MSLPHCCGAWRVIDIHHPSPSQGSSSLFPGSPLYPVRTGTVRAENHSPPKGGGGGVSGASGNAISF